MRIEGFFDNAERRTTDLSDDDGAVMLDRIRVARSLLGAVDAASRQIALWPPELGQVMLTHKLLKLGSFAGYVDQEKQ
jgi:hypothetical protein